MKYSKYFNRSTYLIIVTKCLLSTRHFFKNCVYKRNKTLHCPLEIEKESEGTQLCLTLCDTMDCSLPGSSVHGNFPGKITGGGCHLLLQDFFPSQGLNLGILHCRQMLKL